MMRDTNYYSIASSPPCFCSHQLLALVVFCLLFFLRPPLIDLLLLLSSPHPLLLLIPICRFLWMHHLSFYSNTETEEKREHLVIISYNFQSFDAHPLWDDDNLTPMHAKSENRFSTCQIMKI